MSELNSCPICGCSVRVWAKRFDEEDMEYIIECDNDFCGLTYGISCGYNRDEVKKAWNSVTALSPKVNEDCISRADLIESFLADNECKREEAKACMCSLDSMLELIEDAPPTTPTKRATETMIVDGEETEIDPVSYEIGYTHGQTAPIEKTGEWVKYWKPSFDGTSYKWEKCSICDHDMIGDETNYCPNCGAKMKGGTENE